MISKYETHVINMVNIGNDYGLYGDDFNWLVMLHRTANGHTRELIEERLTDINYHSICKALHDGNYPKALSLYWSDKEV